MLSSRVASAQWSHSSTSRASRRRTRRIRRPSLPTLGAQGERHGLAKPGRQHRAPVESAHVGQDDVAAGPRDALDDGAELHPGAAGDCHRVAGGHGVVPWHRNAPPVDLRVAVGCRQRLRAAGRATWRGRFRTLHPGSSEQHKHSSFMLRCALSAVLLVWRRWSPRRCRTHLPQRHAMFKARSATLAAVKRFVMNSTSSFVRPSAACDSRAQAEHLAETASGARPL